MQARLTFTVNPEPCPPVAFSKPIFKVTVSKDKIQTFKLRKHAFIVMSLTSYFSNEIGGAINK